MLSLQAFLILLQYLVNASYAYVPALPTNSSQMAISGGLNITDISKLHLHWYGNGSYSDNVSYQLAGADSNGISQGVLVHFSEGFINESTPPTFTPWIAMVSCDTNATNASPELDVFTLARDKGAKAALLYSSNSLACIINPEYEDPQNFDHVLDIFSTESLTSAHLIEDQFSQSAQDNRTIYGAYDSQRLNDSGSVINSSITVGYPTTPGYLYAILQAYNATGDPIGPGNGSVSNSQNASVSSGSSSTALAMIVLYAITGCVSALFCIVIISGAIRAIRHPERYGPRSRFGEDGSPPQSRARGLTRAILDTFPVVKFGGAPQEIPHAMAAKDIENPNDPEAPLDGWQSNGAGPTGVCVPMKVEHDRNESHRQVDGDIRPFGSNAIPSTSTLANEAPRVRVVREQYERSRLERGNATDPVPEAIGTETCPICILDFEEGDDLRILPCEGQHRFHQQCVDPWLLELSSSCPICRHDFHALETMMTQDLDDGDFPDPRYSRRVSQAAIGNRFSRYLRFARRRRSHIRQQLEQNRTPAGSSDRVSPEAINNE